jgi:hypothetical protein
MIRTMAAAMTTTTVDLIDVTTVTSDLTVAMTTGIATIIIATIAVLIAMMTIAAKTTVMTATTTGATTAAKSDLTTVTMTTITMTTTIKRSLLHHHHLKRATPTACFKTPTSKSTSSSEVAKHPRATDSSDRTRERSPRSTSKLHNLCGGQSSPLPSPGKTTGYTYPLVVNPIVGSAFVPKILIDGGSSLNIIFTDMLKKMDFVSPR